MTSSHVKSAVRVLEILETLAAHAQPMPTMAIARECDIPKSSAHHILNVMLERNYVTYHDHERAWGLGVSIFEVGSAYLRRTPLQRLGRPLLEGVCADTGEACHLAILHGTDVLYLDKEQPAWDGPNLVTDVGVRLPAHLTAVGWAILAELPEAEVRASFEATPMATRTGSGPASLGALLENLAAVRARGFAFDDQMITPGICCLAAPVFSHSDRPVAALGVSYLAAKGNPALVTRFADAVCAAAARLSASLGWRKPGVRDRGAA
ncbi:MAG TPA: IclR family transcriptional regulator [Solirubrobacterales bacterium]|nr:IclR family transcriptional regulator [Solirubrobacterales bacterium]